MSSTSLIRSPSAPSALTAPPKPASPAPSSPMVLPKLNLTPKTKATPTQPPTPQPSTPGTGTGTPGQWQHPRMQEVLQRQNRSHFDKSNLWSIAINVLAIAISLFAPKLLYSLLPNATLASLRPYDAYTLYLLRAFFAANIAVASRPLFLTADACEDIPLTPAQRQLLGLPPMSRPATPQEKEQWITPPRYERSRSGTPQSPASSLRAQASGSPGSGSMFGGTPTREGSGSPFGSQQQYSPSLRAGAGTGGERRRLSYNARSSPLSASDFDAATTGFPGGESTMSATPTRKGNRASVGLNSKWLYEKGMGMGGKGSPRRGSGGAWDPKGWGTGSVFN